MAAPFVWVWSPSVPTGTAKEPPTFKSRFQHWMGHPHSPDQLAIRHNARVSGTRPARVRIAVDRPLELGLQPTSPSPGLESRCESGRQGQHAADFVAEPLPGAAHAPRAGERAFVAGTAHMNHNLAVLTDCGESMRRVAQGIRGNPNGKTLADDVRQGPEKRDPRAVRRSRRYGVKKLRF